LLRDIWSGLLRIKRWLCGLMRPKLIVWSQMIGNVCDKMRGRACMTVVKGTVKFESGNLIMEECMG